MRARRRTTHNSLHLAGKSGLTASEPALRLRRGLANKVGACSILATPLHGRATAVETFGGGGDRFWSATDQPSRQFPPYGTANLRSEEGENCV